jgi:hypothetical protein
MSDFLVMQQLLSGGGRGWSEAALLIGLFLVLIWQPERIRRLGLFQIACWLFALSFLVPSTFNLLVATEALASAPQYRPSSGSLWPGALTSVYSLGTVFFGASVICALLAILPDAARANPVEPARHPLE